MTLRPSTRIVIIIPATAQEWNGNQNTAVRWAAFLKKARYQVEIQVEWDGRPADLMIALHARRSYDAIRRFSASHPERPLIVMLTGTDLYRDIEQDAHAQESLHLATRLVVLQDKGKDALPDGLKSKVSIVYQSAKPIVPQSPRKRHFDVCVIGHLRPEKDPFRAALALSHLPATSRIRITHMGRALSEEMTREAQSLAAREPRYQWLGGVPHSRVRKELARSRLLVVSSAMEGGANVISEALSAHVPVLASDIPGNIGMLGPDYAGYFRFGDEQALAKILRKAEENADFLRRLQNQVAARAFLVNPEAERDSVLQLVEKMLT